MKLEEMLISNDNYKVIDNLTKDKISEICELYDSHLRGGEPIPNIMSILHNAGVRDEIILFVELSLLIQKSDSVLEGMTRGIVATTGMTLDESTKIVIESYNEVFDKETIANKFTVIEGGKND